MKSTNILQETKPNNITSNVGTNEATKLGDVAKPEAT